MKQLTTLISTLFFLVIGVSQAWALPDCVGSKNVYTWRNCQGTHTNTSGSVYVGQYKHGTMSGQGTYTYADGHKYVGEFWKDQFHGKGAFTWASGSKYVGDFKSGNEHGQGTTTYANEDIYVG